MGQRVVWKEQGTHWLVLLVGASAERDALAASASSCFAAELIPPPPLLCSRHSTSASQGMQACNERRSAFPGSDGNLSCYCFYAHVVLLHDIHSLVVDCYHRFVYGVDIQQRLIAPVPSAVLCGLATSAMMPRRWVLHGSGANTVNFPVQILLPRNCTATSNSNSNNNRNSHLAAAQY